jgi:signal transduction histidine kinase
VTRILEIPLKRPFLFICLLGLIYIVMYVVNVTGYISDQISDSIELGLVVVICIVGFISGREFFRFTHTTPIFLIAMSFLIVYRITELTEEFAMFQQVPLFGKTTLVKNVFETTLMMGSVCFLLGGIYLSVSEINKARKKLDADVTQLRSLASQLSLTEERERHRLAMQLHDHIGQSLIISKAKLDEHRGPDTSGELTDVLEEVCERLDQVIQDTRTLTFDLSSPILYMMGFEAATDQWLADEIKKKHGIETEFEDDGQDKPLDDDIQTVLFRNVRELLINVVKHAKAKKVKVSVRKLDASIRVCIEDDGVGFDPIEIKSKVVENGKFGLFSIRERLEQLGGHVEIDSKTGQGSRIIMTAPLKHVEVTDKAEV